MKIKIGLVYLFLLTGPVLFALDTKIDMKGTIEWGEQKVEAEASLYLPSAGISLPGGRAQAEQTVNSNFPGLVQGALLSIPVDSSSTLADLVKRNEYDLRTLSNIALTAKKFPPALSLDMQYLTGKFTIFLKDIRAELVKHRTLADIPRTLTPVPARAYTGIVILAQDELPVHGRQGKAYPVPCIFPKIWDSRMNLIYEKNMVQPETARNNGIVKYAGPGTILRPTPSGMDDDLIKLVGTNPLRIIAKGVFGVIPTDPVIDRDDALVIISNEENRKLLQEGKVVIILNESTIKKALSF